MCEATMKSGRDLSVRGTVIVALALFAIAWMIYRPDRMRPFHQQDFSEFIPRMQHESGIIGRTHALAAHYKTEGRFKVIPYALLAAKWELFAWWSPGWQMVRAAQMMTLFGLAYVLLRRLGASRLGSVIGRSVFLWAPLRATGGSI